MRTEIWQRRGADAARAARKDGELYDKACCSHVVEWAARLQERLRVDGPAAERPSVDAAAAARERVAIIELLVWRVAVGGFSVLWMIEFFRQIAV